MKPAVILQVCLCTTWAVCVLLVAGSDDSKAAFQPEASVSVSNLTVVRIDNQQNAAMQVLRLQSFNLTSMPMCLYFDDDNRATTKPIQRTVSNNWYTANTFQRRLLNANKPSLTLYYDIMILQLSDISEREQAVKLKLGTVMEWKDCRLVWNASNARTRTEGIDLSVEVYRKLNIFVPNIRMLEEINPKAGLSTESKVRIRSDGTIIIHKEYTTSISCNLDVRMYPFDIQGCNITLESPYSRSLVVLKSDLTERYNETAKLVKQLFGAGRYAPSDTWELIYLRPERIGQCLVTEERVCKNCDMANSVCVHDKLLFMLVFRRLPTYQLINLFLPAVLVALISACVFIIPPSVGDKMGLSVSILISLFVFTQMMYQNMPETGSVIPLMSQFYMFCVLMVSLSCIFSAVGSIFGVQHRTVPHLLRTIVWDCAPLLLSDMMNKRKTETDMAKKQEPEQEPEPEQKQVKDEPSSSGKQQTDESAESDVKLAEAEPTSTYGFDKVTPAPDSKWDKCVLEGDETVHLELESRESVNWNHVDAFLSRCFGIVHIVMCMSVVMVFLIYGVIPWWSYGHYIDTILNVYPNFLTTGEGKLDEDA